VLTGNRIPNMDTTEIQKHINSLSKEDWQKLFRLIPEIEATKEFSTGGDLIQDEKNPEKYRITQEIEAPIVFKFLDIIEDLGLIFPFDWSNWEVGKRIFKENKYENADTLTLLKLINAFIRSDHFSYGAGLASRFQDGTIQNILKEIEKNVETE
jgi:hypothetical protein